jgi:hypothetical protein
VDEQFASFVEMIQKIHVNIPMVDVMHVPTYARYIKDITNNKRPLPTMEVVKLTKECSAAILNHRKRRRIQGAQQSQIQLGRITSANAMLGLVSV